MLVRITNFCKEPQKEEREVARKEGAWGRLKEEMGLGREKENRAEDAGRLGPRKKQWPGRGSQWPKHLPLPAEITVYCTTPGGDRNLLVHVVITAVSQQTVIKVSRKISFLLSHPKSSFGPAGLHWPEEF